MRREKKGALLSRLEGLLEVVGFELTTETSRPVHTERTGRTDLQILVFVETASGHK